MKKRLIILHGWTYSLDKWQPLLDWLRKQDFNPVMLEVPGLTTASDKIWSLDDYVSWLEAATKAEEGPFVLVGHSNGGRIAMAFTAQHSQRINQLILIDSAGVYHNELRLRLKRLVFGTAAKVGKRLTSSDKARQLLYRLARSQDYNTATPNMKQTMLNMLAADQTLPIASITAPTTLIWGDQDALTPLSDGRKLNQLIAGSKLNVIHGSRHAPFFDQPEAVGKIIGEALA